MNKIPNYTLVLLCVFFNTYSFGQNKYQADWESLSKYPVPDWFRDAKFGIYTHWGPNTVAGEDAPDNWAQWFGMRMYMESNPIFEFSKNKYGDQHTFGYKNIIPLFTGSKFDADAWADLFKASGAKFAGPVGIHHDNFAMWDSKVTRWNSVKMGPHKDFVGALEKAIKARDMHYMVSFHHSYTWEYFQHSFEYDAADPAYSDLYTTPHEEGAPPNEEFLKLWLEIIEEAVVNYKPSLIWFDMGFHQDIPESSQKEMFSFYYNWADNNGIEAMVTHKGTDIHKYTGVLDFERGREDAITPYPWLTDDSIKDDTWFYQKSDTTWKSANDLICLLADIVSKNGNLLLNVDPMPDGTFQDQTVDILKNVGQWLSVNGESIYNTRPWNIYGEGAENDIGSIRYTRSKDNKTIYAVILNWLGSNKELVDLKSIKEGEQNIKSVYTLGSEVKLDWKWSDGCLQVEIPSQNSNNLDVKAVALKINLN